MTTDEHDDVKEAVRKSYGQSAATRVSCCAPGSTCCSPSAGAATGGTRGGAALPIGVYSDEDLAVLPADADLGLGCGNPLALQSLRAGETVVDLGSGPGLDCFLAAKAVGPDGRVIGIDMTPEMIELATENARTAGFDNVEFRLGEIEALPVTDDVADIVISNCVINLVRDKRRAFAEAFRVTKPGGRLSVSDIVTTEPLPDAVRDSLEAYVTCAGGALQQDSYLGAIAAAGYEDVRVMNDHPYATTPDEADDVAAAFGLTGCEGVDAEEARRVAMLFHSVTVHATKPLG